MTNSRTDLYSRVTDVIVAELEKGVCPWLKPWGAAHVDGRITRPLRASGEPYKGINVLMLWGEAMIKGYGSPHWMTYRQATACGGQVRKGEHGSLVVYADRFRKTETADSGEEIEREIPFLKGYTVFNAEQIDGLPERFYQRPTAPASAFERIAQAEHFAASTKAAIHHGGNRAFYALEADRVQMPPFESFTDAESYYATLLHELTHWTRHPNRLERDFGRKRWGDAGYAAEELVAELSAAFLCADLEITPEPRADHASYIANWLEVLKGDKRAIFTAAAHAQRASDYLHSLQPNAGDDSVCEAA